MLVRLLLIITVFFTLNSTINAQSDPVKVVILGSSTALGSAATNNYGWAKMFRDYMVGLNPGNVVKNLALSGISTSDILPEPDGWNEVNITRALGENPDIIIINLPSNDAYWNRSVAKQIENYQTVVNLATLQGVRVFIATTQPRNFEGSDRPAGDDYTPAEKRQNLMDTRDALFATFGSMVIDFWTDLANADGTINPIYDAGDHIHLNDAGHLVLYNRVIAANILGPKINITLNTPQPICGGNEVEFLVDVPVALGTLSLQYRINQQTPVAFTGTSFTYLAPSESHTVAVIGTSAGNVNYISNTVLVPRGAGCPKDKGQITAVVLGSSTAVGVGASTGNSWVYQFEEYLKSIHQGSEVYNLAASGYTTYRILPDTNSPPSELPTPDTQRNITRALSYNPDVIIINLPSNDAAAGYSVADQMGNYATIVSLATAANVPVYITTTQPRNLNATGRQNLMDARDATIANYPDKVIDFWNGLATNDGNILSRFDYGDGIHINNNGHSLVANRVLQANIIEPEISLSYTNSTLCANDVVNFNVSYPESLGELSLKYHINRNSGVDLNGSSFQYTMPYNGFRAYVVGKAANGDSYVSNIVYTTIDQSCYVGDPINLVILGSSTAEGWGATGDYGWAQMYEDYIKSLNPYSNVWNLSKSGYSTIQIMPTGSPGADSERNITKALSYNPDVIIINLPSNDAANDYPVVDQLSRYSTILSAAAAQNVPVYITTTQPRNLTFAGRENLMTMRDSTFSRYGEFAVDFWNVLATSDGFLVSAFDDGDGIHLNDAGHTLVFNRMVNAGVVNPRVAVTASQSFVNPGDEVEFTVTTTVPGIVTYQYYVNNKLVATSGSPVFNYVSPLSNYKVYVIGRDAANEPYLSRAVYVTVNSNFALWTGAVNSSWDNLANWHNGNAPAANIPVSIRGNASHMPVINNQLVVLGNLTINPGAVLTLNPGGKLTINATLQNNGELVFVNQTGTNGLSSLINNGSITGSALSRVKLTLPGNQWFYLSSPFESPVLGRFNNTEAGATVHVYRNNQWYSTSSSLPTIPLNPLEGILVKYASNPYLLEYTGQLNNGLISQEYATGGWKLFGNPYPSFIDWQQNDGWSRPNIDGTMWYRTLDDGIMKFITYNRNAAPGSRSAYYPGSLAGEAAEAELSLIPPLQSVWIKANGPTILSVNNAVRKHGVTESYLKSSSAQAPADIIRIIASNKYTRDGAVIYFHQQSDNGLDAGDSEKRFNDSNLVPEVYTRVQNSVLAINSQIGLDNTSREISLSVRNRVNDDVTLSFNLEKFNHTYSVHLEDKLTNQWINLLATPDYTYTPSVLGDVHNRFALHINYVPTSADNNDDLDSLLPVVVYNSGGDAIVLIESSLVLGAPAKIEIYTIEGHKVEEITTNKSENRVRLPGNSSVFIIKVIAGDVVVTKKVLRLK